MRKDTNHITLCASVDGGYSTHKTQILNVTGRTANDLHVDGIYRALERSIYAPLPSGDLTNILGIADTGDGVSGLTGAQAALLNPSLWSQDSTEAHYGSAAQQLFIRMSLLRYFTTAQTAPGNVSLYLSLGVAGMHSHYAPMIRATFSTPFVLKATDGRVWNITPKFVEVKAQPFWLVIDHLSRWNSKSGLLNKIDYAPLLRDNLLVVFDFGSLTFQGAAYAGSLETPRREWCEPVGSWSQIRDELKRRLQAKAMSQGVRLYEPNQQELLSCYETGVFTRGKQSLDMTDEIREMVAPKVLQRLKIAEQQLRGAGDVGNMLIAGGDCERNLSAFLDEYEEKIAGSIHVMADEQGNADPMWRLSSGALKGAIRRYLMEAK